MELILFRHGIAEEPGTRPIDTERQLTDKGKRRVRLAGKVLRKMGKGASGFVIWTSPLVRAVETAQLLSEELDNAKVEVKPWIAEGTFFHMEEALKAWEREETLLITGHAPDLDDWCLALSGVDLQLGKGAAAGIRMVNGKLDGQLLWVIQGAAWKRFL